MALTDFGKPNRAKLTAWQKEVWVNARNHSFLKKFTGESSNSMVHRITELTKNEKGERAIVNLLADLAGDGVVGDNTLEGKEEALNYFEQEITFDQLRHANRSKGKLNSQQVVNNFRKDSKNVLAYWLGDRMDQLAFLTLSGISYAFTNNGGVRAVDSQFPQLNFASQVAAPSANRHLRWDGTAKALVAGDTTAVAATDLPSWKMIVDAKAYAQENYFRGVQTGGNEEVFHAFMSPAGMAALRNDADYLAALKNAGVRGKSNELFTGADSVLIDGTWIHSFRHVFNTKGAATGSKWGAGSAINGQRVLVCGAQALAIADINAPEWDEKDFDYGNQQGIAIAKMFGLLKPKFHSPVTGTTEDFNCLCIDTAI